MFSHHHRNTETFRLGGTFANHLFRRLAQSKVNSVLRPGLPGLCAIRSWKPLVMDVPQPLWETKTRAQGLVIPVVKFFYLGTVSPSCFNLTDGPHSSSMHLRKETDYIFLVASQTHQPVLPWINLLSLSEDKWAFVFLSPFKALPQSPLPFKDSRECLHNASSSLNTLEHTPWSCVGWDSQEIPDSAIWALLLMSVLFLNPVSRPGR